MWVDVDGGRLYVETSGAGTPILMAHGWSLDHRLFEFQAEELAKTFQVITFDRRGFGVSQAAPGLVLEVEDMRRILQALSLESVHLLGMSQGARIALRFAVTHAHAIRSLLLQGPAIDGVAIDEPASQRIPIEQYAELARAGRMDEARRRWSAHPMMAMKGDTSRARDLLDRMLSSYQGADLLADAANSPSSAVNVLAELGSFRAPCLLLTGAADTPARKAAAAKLLQVLPDCREIVFTNSGHLSNLSESALYNREVADFCAKADAKWLG
ncbi:MAG TPA: alpha/beta hydrolase, partial [Woeseiaceae bacterium]